MKINELWLREWVNPEVSIEELAAQLTMAGLEVDSVNPVAGTFSGVVVAEVLNAEPHPQADKLKICSVKTCESEHVTIVCGASNVRAGLKVALAKIGAVLPGGMKIKEAKLRGELSQGMICSASELGLEDRSEGILELPTDAPIGQDIIEYMVLNDSILDVDLTPNRADCFSVLGIAREIATLTKQPLKAVPTHTIKPTIDDTIKIKVEASAACPNYFGRVIRGIDTQTESPLWLKESLRRCGIRSKHPVVDVTNYVMLELGQPMHAFDKSIIDGDIVVRFAHPKEKMTLLDGQNVELSESVLVIADDNKALAMAGIMGGENSTVNEQTTDIFLESAYFNPIQVAGVARQHGLCTDSSQRFERGVDPIMQAIAIERATELLLKIVGGDAGPLTKCIDASNMPSIKKVTFNPSRVAKLTGVELEEDAMENMLQRLGMSVDSSQLPWVITVPSHRFDIELEVDVIEEVIRINGYDAIEPQPMVTNAIAGQINLNEQTVSVVSDFLLSRGYQEAISYSFVDPDVQEVIYPNNTVLELLNPISSELSQMRAGMWPGLIASMIYNLHRQQTAIKLFEAGVVFDMDDKSLVEKPCIGGIVVGEADALNWSSAPRSFDYYDIKGDIEALLKHLKIADVQFVANEHPALHPGKSAQIIIKNQPAGWVGLMHPKHSDELDINDEVILYELDVEPLKMSARVKYESISKYPQIRRDLSLLVDASVSALDIQKAVESAVDAKLLKSFHVFDVYTGGNIPEDKKSIAVALILKDDSRTLVDAEINVVIDAIIKALETKFAITLRD
jgi:phenylalanyl-tRNA synthetase beta chain